MGFYDRDYYRESRPPDRSVFGGQRLMVTNLVILNGVVFLLNMFVGGANDRLTNALAIQPETLVQPWLWWKFVTYGFAHDPTDIGHIFWNMLGLWLFGREVEGLYGRWEFLRIYLTALVLGSLVWCLRGYFGGGDAEQGPLLGASGAVTAVVLLFVFHFPTRTILLMFVLPVPAWVMGVLQVGGDLMLAVTRGGASHVAYDVHLVGAAFAAGYFYRRWNLGRFLPAVTSLRWPARRPAQRPTLRIHDPEEFERQQDEEADRILEKVNRQGLASLTDEERGVLEDYSRRLRRRSARSDRF